MKSQQQNLCQTPQGRFYLVPRIAAIGIELIGAKDLLAPLEESNFITGRPSRNSGVFYPCIQATGRPIGYFNLQWGSVVVFNILQVPPRPGVGTFVNPTRKSMNQVGSSITDCSGNQKWRHHWPFDEILGARHEQLFPTNDPIGNKEGFSFANRFFHQSSPALANYAQSPLEEKQQCPHTEAEIEQCNIGMHLGKVLGPGCVILAPGDQGTDWKLS